MDEGCRCEAGGIEGLVALLTEQGEAVERSLQEKYAVDLADLMRGPVRWRRLRVLVTGLAEWTLDQHLAAGIYDVLRFANWNGKGAKPKPLPRPGDADDDDRTVVGRGGRMSFEEAAEWLASMRESEQ